MDAPESSAPNRRQSSYNRVAAKRGSVIAVSTLTKMVTPPRFVAPAPPSDEQQKLNSARVTAREHQSIVDSWLTQVKDASVIDNAFTLLALIHHLGIQVNESVEKIVEKHLHLSENRVSLEGFVAIVEDCKQDHERARRRASFRQKDLIEAFSALAEHGSDLQGEATNQQKREFQASTSQKSASASLNDRNSPEDDGRGGTLDANEMKNIIHNFHLGIDTEGLLRDLDLDHDSHVNFNELMTLLTQDGPTSPTDSEGRSFDSLDKSVHNMNYGFRTKSMRRGPRKSVVVMPNAIDGHATSIGAGGDAGGIDMSRSVRDPRSNIRRFVSKNPLAMTPFYRALQNAATNVSDMEQFRSRCGALMASADRLGEPRQKATSKGPTRPSTAGSNFSRLAADNRERAATFRSANKNAIAERQAKEKEQQELKSRVQKIQQAIDKKLEDRLEDRRNSVNNMGSPSLPRVDSERRSLRTGSIAFSELEDIAAENDGDDNKSVYSTSSSQRSIDLKQSVLISRESSQAHMEPSGAADGQGGAVTHDAPFALPPSTANAAASFRSRSFANRQSVASNGTSRTALSKRTNIGDRRVLSTQIIVRLTSNANQIRMHKVTPPAANSVMGNDGASANSAANSKPKTPSMITARARAKKTHLSNEDKVTTCLVDDYGEERLEIDSKLFECYFGKT